MTAVGNREQGTGNREEAVETGAIAYSTTTHEADEPRTTNHEPQAEYKLGPIEQIPPGEGRQFHLAGQDIAVFRARNGRVYATQAVCPHRNGPLIDGLLGGSILVCPLHNWKWNLDTGQVLMGECALTMYSVHLDAASEIILRVG